MGSAERASNETRTSSSLGMIRPDVDSATDGGNPRVKFAEESNQSPGVDRFRLLCESAPIGIYLNDAEGRCIYVNRRYCELSGLSNAQAMGDGWITALHPDDRHWVLADWQRAHKQARRSIAEFRLLRPDGSTRWVHGEAEPWYDDQSQRSGYLGTIQDVTKSREESNRLAEQLRFGEFVSRLSTEFVRVGPEDLELAIESALQSIADYTNVERAGVGLFSEDGERAEFKWGLQTGRRPVVANDERNPLSVVIAESPLSWYWTQALAGKNIVIDDVESLLPAASAERNHYRDQAVRSVLHLSINVAEQAIGFIVLKTMRNQREWNREFVSQMELVAQIFGNAIVRTRAESARRASDEQYRMIFDKSADGIIIIDLEGRVAEANSAYCAFLGYKREELLQLSPQEFIHPNSHHLFDEFFETVSRGEPYYCNAQDLHKDGHAIDIEVSGWLMPFRGEPHLAAIVRDVTERQVAKNKLREQQAILAHITRLSTMGELVTEIVHELNQPLYSIGNCGRALRNALAAQPPDIELARECSEQILQGSERGGEMISRLRNFVRRQSPALTATDVNTLVQESVQLMDFEIRRHDVQVEFDLAKDLPGVEVEPIQIQQVFVNLLRNACEAMQQAQVARPRIVCRTQLAGSEIHVTVTDTGPGVTDEALGKMFTAFETTKSDGLGMGLAISKSIIESHGGRIEYLGERPGETTFRVSLPTKPRRGQAERRK